MKTKKFSIGLLLLAGLFFFNACQDEKITPEDNSSIVPTNFSVNIPDVISYNASQLKSTNGDKMNGRQVYEPLGYFIKIGEGAAEIVQSIMVHIAIFKIDGPMNLTYVSDEDGRDKNLVVTQNAEYAGKQWEFKLLITDAANEGNADGGKALEIFWNRTPVEGIALLKPANINATDSSDVKNAVFRIDYSEANDNGYTNEMTVYIADLPILNPLEDPFSCNAIKLWAGKDGNYIDVRGNSNHPNARFFDTQNQQGFNWAFVASSNESTNIACVEVGLPPSNLDNESRSEILGNYSVRNVFEREIFKVWPELQNPTDTATQVRLNDAFADADAPGYFDATGFVKGGIAPSSDYDVVKERIQLLAPFNPISVSQQTIELK